MPYQHLASYDTELFGDAVECHVPPSADEVWLAYATYQWSEDEGTRRGHVGVLSLIPSETAEGGCTLDCRSRLETSGVLDLRWVPTSGALVSTEDHKIVTAQADGTVQWIRYSGGVKPSLRVDAKVQGPGDASALTLSVDVSQDGARVACSGSDGSIRMLDIGQAGPRAIYTQHHAHSLEAWCASLDPSDIALLYSTGDDGAFLAWDLRQSGKQPVMRTEKAHGAVGVTTIIAGPDPQTLLSGGYDDKLRVWDRRVNQNPILVAELGLGGGVWRIKPHPTQPSHVLVPCMYDGAKVVNWRRPECIVEYPGHQSIVYGGCWVPTTNTSSLAVSISFYDHSLQVWKLDIS